MPQAEDKYTKQFAGKGNLKALNPWISAYNVTDEDTIEVEFLSSTSLKLSKV
jgi:TorA maturation chaperone TorD